MNKLLTGVSAGVVLLMAGGTAFAQELPGKFEGVTIDAKLIGGQQYEALYSRISEWEKATGATVNVISKKNHFELDKEIKEGLHKNLQAWITDPDGNKIELMQMSPESPQSRVAREASKL